MRTMLLILGFLLLPAPVAAQPTFDDPVVLVEHVYAPYLKGEFRNDPRELFSPTLRQLWEDMTARSEELDMPIVDYDPFVNAQDFDISDLVIADPVVTGSQATVAVSFLNFGEPVELRYFLVQGAGGWKIDDIETLGGDYLWRLSETLAADPLLN